MKIFLSWLRVSSTRPVQILGLQGLLEFNLAVSWADSYLTRLSGNFSGQILGLLSSLEGILVFFSGEILGLLEKLEMNLDLFLPGLDASFNLT